MPSFAQTVLSTVAAIALVQFCPAPMLAAIPEAVVAGVSLGSGVVGAAAGVAGDVITAVNSRDLPNRRRQAQANQLAWQLCHDQLGSATLVFSAPQKGNVLVEGIPPACMTLATVLTGKYNEGNPVPMGSSSILFQNLSDADIQEIQDALNARQ